MLVFVVTIRLVKHSVGPILLLRLHVRIVEATLTASVVDVCFFMEHPCWLPSKFESSSLKN